MATFFTGNMHFDEFHILRRHINRGLQAYTQQRASDGTVSSRISVRSLEYAS